MITTLKELNKKGLYTKEQILTWKKFRGKYIKVYPEHYTYRNNDRYETVFEVRGIRDEIEECYNLPAEEMSFYN